MELLKTKVLVVNRQWQGYEETDVATALCDMYRGACTAIDTENMVPVAWDDWIKLPIREGDRAIYSSRQDDFGNPTAIRVPTVVCKAKYAEMPKRRPKWSKRGVAKRDKFVCQITGKYAPDGNVDHVYAQSKGGRDTWANTVWTDRKVNTKKADKDLKELGWKLIKRPEAPPEVPKVRLIAPKHDDWVPFLRQ